MKTLTLTMMQVVRIAIMLDNHQGQRKDLKIVRDIRERLNLDDDQMTQITTPVAGGMSISNVVHQMPDIEITLAPAEARKLLEILDGQTLISRDLVWADPLANELTEVAGR